MINPISQAREPIKGHFSGPFNDEGRRLAETEMKISGGGIDSTLSQSGQVSYAAAQGSIQPFLVGVSIHLRVLHVYTEVRVHVARDV